MKRNTKTLLIISILIASLLFTACSQTQSTDAAASSGTDTSAVSGQPSGSSGQAAANDANAVYGEVTAINGNVITLSVGTLNQQARPSGSKQQGAKPSGSAGNAGQNPPDANASGQPDGQPPQGSMPADPNASALPSGSRPSMLTMTGESKTITVTDESVITMPSFNRQGNGQNGKASASASAQASTAKTGLSAIQVGTTLRIEYDSDKTTIKSIMIMGGFGRGNASGGQNAAKPDASASAS